MAMVVGDRRGSVVALTLAAALGGCLEGPSSDATSSSTSTGSVETTGTDTTGTSSTSIESSTGPDTSTTATASSGTTDVGPTCSDGQQNGAETDVDCGGGCIPCDVGEACLVAADCKTALCDAGVCQAPECTGDGDCSPLTTACAKGTCDKQSNTCTTTPINEGNACDDGDLCTTSDTCKSGACVAGPAVDCSEFDSPCTVGKCDPNSGSCGSYDQPDGTSCDDGDGCTFNEQCMQGACVAPAGEGAIFYDDFSSPAGWTAQAPWAIGAAKQSPAGEGGADPGTDHTPTDDNGLAGTAIGGLDPLAAHGALCLTSPSFDTTQAGNSLWLSFWRHLHAPATPGVTSKIEIWNGVAWKTVASGYPQTINDVAWSFQKYNITGNGAKDFKVRICVERQQGSPDFAGWSLDDLVVAPTACTP